MTFSLTPDRVAYIRYRLVLAQETLHDAHALMAHGHLRSVVNRIYYACFYVVEGLLRTEGLHSARHSGVLSLLDGHWVKTRRIPSDMADFYHEVFDKRQAGDYVAFVEFDRSKVEEWLRQAERFIGCLSDLVVRALPEQR